jgi:hypothetical protein
MMTAMPLRTLTSLATLAYVISDVTAYSTGAFVINKNADYEACVRAYPIGHQAVAEDTPAPFELIISRKTYTPMEEMTGMHFKMVDPSF